jgi:outer membrane protein assembly factor BamC
MSNIHLGGLGLLAALLLSACSLTPTTDSIDYKSAGEKKTPNLVYPPDLTQPVGDKRYAVAEGSAATLSQYNETNKVKPKETSTPTITLEQAGIKIERDGDKRWLVVNKPVAELYPKIKNFWEESGFLLVTDSPQTGIMETDWSENRAKIPQDFLRRNLGKVLDSIYSTGERDKFRTRLEPGKAQTEIYVTHRGSVEKLVGSLDGNSTQGTMWTGRPSDPELEAEMLSRMMVYLGLSAEKAKEAVASSKSDTKQVASRIEGAGATMALALTQNFDRAWREVGLALDRSSFTVEDRDRAQGVYYVRVVDSSDFEAEKKAGFFANLFGSSSKEDQLKKAKRYRVIVKSGGSATATRVTLAEGDGQAAGEKVAKQVLTILDEQVAR